MKEYPKSVTKHCTKKILEQMDNLIYKIYENKDIYDIGFFSKIKFKKEIIPILITSHKIINEKYLSNNNTINISSQNNIPINLVFGNTKYLNKDYDLSIIEIKDTKFTQLNTIEIDDIFYENEQELFYEKETIYIIHPEPEQKNENCVTYGVINNINNYDIYFYGNINSDSYGAPIFSINDHKLLGIYKSNSGLYNKGIILKFIIDQFIKEYKQTKIFLKYNKYFNNEINIEIKIDKDDIGKKIYFLDNYNENHNNLKELNELNAKIYVDNKESEFKKYFRPKEKKIYNIKLKFNMNITDSSYMFAGCENITNINFKSFNTCNIKNMKYMFYGCKNLKNINLLSFNTENVTDMSYMFCLCHKLKKLDLSSFTTKNVTNMSNMFSCCKHLQNLDIPFFDTQKLIDTSYMFFDCWKLKTSSFPCLKNVKKKDHMFSNRWNKNKINKDDIDFGDTMNNVIYILIDIDESKINEKIYFLSNEFKDTKLNDKNSKIYINKKPNKYSKYFIPDKDGEYEIILKFNIGLKDCDLMFKNCENIIYINFVSFDTKNPSESMLSEYEKFKNPNASLKKLIKS